MMIAVVIALLVGGGAGFVGGMKYQSSISSGLSQRDFLGNRGGGNTQNRTSRLGGGRPVAGEILSVDDKSITVKLQDGSSKIVFLSTTTTYNKASEGAKNDLKKGDKVAAYGTENTDGSVTAVNVQLNPSFSMMGGGSNRTQNQTQNTTQP